MNFKGERMRSLSIKADVYKRQYGDSGHWVVNSGVSKVFGEYDAEGNLIREFSYECDMQNYRTFKYDFTGFWFE